MHPSSHTLPLPQSSSDGWVWRVEQEISWLSCQLLEAWPHGFWTRHAHPHKPNALAPLLDLIGSRAAWAHQVHGNDSVWSTPVLPELNQPDLSKTPSRPRADAVITAQKGGSAWVCTADCVPILLASTQSPVVAAIHAGWRGTAAAISVRVIERLLQSGLNPTSLRLAIGPAISGPAYQVSEEVAAQVLQTLPTEQHETVLLPDPEPERVRLDLKQANKLQMIHLGIPPDQISISPHCTRDQAEQFFSYRRAGGSLRDPAGVAQVQWSGIGIR